MTYFSRRQREPWRDVMQVCLNGHVINAGYQKFPKYNKEYCDRCGEKTIIECPNCNNPIPGDMQDTGVGVFAPRVAPEYCQSCGNAFPWLKSEKKIESIDLDSNSALDDLTRIFSNFHEVVKQLRRRYSKRPTLDVSDEHDVQDLLHSLLKLFFTDIRPEEVTPSYAGKSSRVDFLLKDSKIMIEVKMTRENLGEKELGDQLLIDIARYKERQDCNKLVCFIYDPLEKIVNPQGFINDIMKNSTEKFEVQVFVAS